MSEEIFSNDCEIIFSSSQFLADDSIAVNFYEKANSIPTPRPQTFSSDLVSSATRPSVSVIQVVNACKKRKQNKNSPSALRKVEMSKRRMFEKYLSVEFSLTFKLNVILKYEFLYKLCSGKKIHKNFNLNCVF